MDTKTQEHDGQGHGAGGNHHGDNGGGKFYTLFVDDKEFQVSKSVITGGEIMELAGIALSVGLVLIDEDGTQHPVPPGVEIELKPGRRFKKAPRFKRG